MKIRAAEDCRFDEVSLGEVMLRLDPGDSRIRSTREFRVWEGGGEYNVARGLSKCFGLRTAVVTGLVKNDIGYLIEDLMNQGKVNTDYVIWRDFDGIGAEVRNGLNFTEKGFGVRGALGISDRSNTASSQLKVGDIDWDEIFGVLGARWFHTGGIFAALSGSTSEVIIEAVKAAKKHGTIVSYDLNYRPSLWKSHGGMAEAQRINKEIAPYIDVMFGNEEDFHASMGFELGSDDNYKSLDVDLYQDMIRRVADTYPNLKVIGNSLRTVHTATVNDWAGQVWCEGEFFRSCEYPKLEIFDRVGGGDSFASGLIYGIINGLSMQKAVDYGAAHGALVMTTPGDTSMSRLSEVATLAEGGSARVVR